MDDDLKIQQAITNGENNKQAMELIRNWCRHARVIKVGGTGMIEMQTGLPIGHHAMACDHAAAQGMGCRDLRDAALDFHDRNCVGCPHRAPVGVPNLSTLLIQRDQARRQAEEEAQARTALATERRNARREMRQTLRAKLNPVSATIVDHLEELDQDNRSDAGTRLLGLAKLAPESFLPEVVEHCFGLCEHHEGWFEDTGLRLLQQLRADPARLTRCALKSLARHWSSSIAFEIVEANVTLIDATLVAGALPALVGRANPEQGLGMSAERRLEPGPLLAVYRAQPKETELAIGQLLDRRDPYLVSAGARAIEVLVRCDKNIASRFARTVAAKLVRAKHLIDRRETGYAGDDEVIHHLQKALELALKQSPAESDALVMQFMASAPHEGEARAYCVYSQLLRHEGRGEDPTPGPAARLALKRLLSAASDSTNEDVLREIQSAFSYVPDEMQVLARAEFTAILGAAILLDDRIRTFDAEPAPKTDFLGTLERRNRRNTWVSLQRSLVDWAANAAADDPSATEQYLQVYEGIPEERDLIRSRLIRDAYHLMQTPEGLNALLPTLYSSMLGTSTLVRAAASEALGKLSERRRDDVPDLMYEAYTALLSDPYVIVHSAAAEALSRIDLPQDLRARAQNAVGRLIDAYAVSRQDDSRLLEFIEVYLRRFATEAQLKGQLGTFFVALLEKLKPELIADKLRSLRRSLRHVEGFAGLVLRTLANPQITEYREEHLIRTLNDLPVAAIQTIQPQLEEIALAAHGPRSLTANLVETLTRTGAWSAAARINEAIYAKMPATTEMRPQKLMMNLDRLAAKYEETIALGHLEALPALAKEWRETEALIETDRKQHETRRRPFPSIPGPH
jgi:hypothetical protein